MQGLEQAASAGGNWRRLTGALAQVHMRFASGGMKQESGRKERKIGDDV
jgi:hypothetical protein